MGGALGIFIAAVLLIAAAITAGLVWASGGITVALMAWFVFISFLLILVVLVQKPKGGGLSGAFGGGGGGAQAMMGAQTGYALTVATVTFFVAFLGLGVWLTLDMKPVSANELDATIEGLEGSATTTSDADVTVTTDEADDVSGATLEDAPEEAATDADADAETIERPDNAASEIGQNLVGEVEEALQEADAAAEEAQAAGDDEVLNAGSAE